MYKNIDTPNTIEKKKSFVEKTIESAKEKINQILAKFGVLKTKTKEVGQKEISKIEKETMGVIDNNLLNEVKLGKEEIANKEAGKTDLINKGEKEIKEIGIKYKVLGSLEQGDPRSIIEEVLEIANGPTIPLGDGTTAKVYRVEGKKCCFKEITNDPDKLREMKRLGVNTIDIELEIQRMAVECGVRSPKTLMDINDENTGRRFILMETIEGPTLEEALIDNSKLPQGFDLEFFTVKLTEMVEKLNKNGIYHRDLFERNIMINKDGHPVIIDYGLSKIAKEGEDPYSFIDSETGEELSHFNDSDRLRYMKNYVLDKLPKKI